MYLELQPETKSFTCQWYWRTANHTVNTTPSTATPESLISKFLEDLKAIINPLLLLLTTVVNHLLPSSFPIPPP
ncbi:unnamed protein product [Macrosiphum euphorbiae]|uniref:Uncharacterized protein n=1 Tax=Macrosiphum euphorbiae TaxID=13131 RepID=A0AAV0VTL8_9HEMI|nr:unnamed protein product [Macrosiphum euphorbiae]